MLMFWICTEKDMRRRKGEDKTCEILKSQQVAQSGIIQYVIPIILYYKKLYIM